MKNKVRLRAVYFTKDSDYTLTARNVNEQLALYVNSQETSISNSPSELKKMCSKRLDVRKS